MTEEQQQPPPPPTPPTTAHEEPGLYVALTHSPLDAGALLARVRSPLAGANVLFSGTTRDSFGGRAVAGLTYQAYAPLALATLRRAAAAARRDHALTAVAVVHRLGPVPVGEESILVAVASPHRQAAWRAGEALLEEVKARAEIWKLERFVDDDEGVWRANRDGAAGVRVPASGAGGGEGGRDGGGEPGEGDVKGQGNEQVPELMGPVIRPRRPGEAGHGAVVNPRPQAAPE